ncbi:hypothetical protein L0222_28115 [bacterium]|nr:hypothetical protein [bacterium]
MIRIFAAGGLMKANQKGFSTVLALGIISVVFLLILSGLLMVNLASKLITRQLLYQGQALNAAEAGLIDALNYFRRQPGAVPTFDPAWDDTALPVPLDDSAEPAIGIVRDYRVSDLGDLCGRYEVRRQDLDKSTFVESNEEGRGVQDITDNRGRLTASPGNVWLLESHGYIYFDHTGACRLNGDGGGDPNAIPTVEPDYLWGDKVLVRRTLRSQIQRMTITLPGEAAILAEIGENINIGNALGDNVRLLGGPAGYGVLYSIDPITMLTTGPANINPASDVQGGLGPEGALTPWNDEILEVFGVTQAELVGSADNSYADAAAMLASWSLKLYVVTDGNFTTTKPLIGSGILVVLEDCMVPAGSNFQGFIYVAGNYTQEGPSLVSGAVMAKGNVTIYGAGDTAEVDYDSDMINQVEAEMIQYRFARNPYLYTAN